MQSYKHKLLRLSSNLSRLGKPTKISKPNTITPNKRATRTMSLFPRSTFYTPDSSFAPLVRLLNDWDTYTQEGLQRTGGHGQRHGAVQTFSPKFDVLETDNDYQLHGELGGIAKKDVHLEFTDEHTLVVKGRIEKSYSTGDLDEEEEREEGEPAAAAESHKVTVRDADDNGEEQGEASGEVVHQKQQQQQRSQPKKPKYKYWLSERSVGEFSRVFQFPGRVERDGVTAALDNGILTVKVPKAKKIESRRIDIA